MNKPLVSVVIPAYNAVNTLAATVRSILDQTFQDFEILVVDDGSKDETLKLAQSLAAADSRIKALTQPNGGVSSARNAGIRAARGEYVAFVDADDLWLPPKLERQIAVFAAEKDVRAIQTGAYYVNNDLEVQSVRPCFESKDALLETLLFQNLPQAAASIIVKRAILDEVGMFDTSLVILEDWEFMIRMARFCNLKSIEEPLVLYRRFPGNRSRNLSIHIEPGHIVLERLFKDPTLPERIRQNRALIYSTFYRMLSGGAFNVGRYGEWLKFGVKSVITHPASVVYMASLPVRRMQRVFSRENVSEDYKNLVKKSFKQAAQ